MVQQLLITNHTITFDYDPLQDMLYILFEPVTGATFYEDVPDMPGIMRRYRAEDERLIGITAHNVKDRLPPGKSPEQAVRQLAQSLVEQLI